MCIPNVRVASQSLQNFDGNCFASALKKDNDISEDTPEELAKRLKMRVNRLGTYCLVTQKLTGVG